MTTLRNVKRVYLPTVTLVLANAVPVYGVLFWNWDVFPLMYIYFLETVAIVTFGLGKIMLAKGRNFFVERGFISDILLSQFFPQLNSTSSKFSVLPAYFICSVIYLALCLFVFLVLFSPKDFSIALDPEYMFALIGFIISHGISFIFNYIGKKEYTFAVPYTEMTEPFDRIMAIITVFTISAYIIIRLNQNALTLLVLIAIKLIFDFIAHHQEHQRFQSLMANMILVDRVRRHSQRLREI